MLHGILNLSFERSFLLIVGCKRNTVINLEKLKTVNLNMHQNILPSHHKQMMSWKRCGGKFL